jgi:hypothetical protein
MPDKRSEEMPMQELVAAVAGPREWGDTRQSWIARAARRANISYRQARAIFYGEIDDPEHKAVRRMQAAIDHQQEKDAANELADLRSRIARLEALLVSSDADFHRPTLDSLRESDGGVGSGRGPVD